MQDAFELPDISSDWMEIGQVGGRQCSSNIWPIGPHTGLIQVKEEGWPGFSKGWQGCPTDFPRAKPKGNPKEQPCQPKENPVLPDSFTQIYILFPTRIFKVLRSAQLTSDDKLQILTQLSFHLGASHELNTIFFLGTNFLGQFDVWNFEQSYCLNG